MLVWRGDVDVFDLGAFGFDGLHEKETRHDDGRKQTTEVVHIFLDLQEVQKISKRIRIVNFLIVLNGPLSEDEFKKYDEKITRRAPVNSA